MRLKNPGKKLYYIKNAMLAFLWHCVTGFKKNNVIIFGAGNGYYENNIAVFHGFVKKENTTFDNIYFVSDTFDKVRNFIVADEYLKRGSFRCYLKSFRAKVLVIDTCNSDVSPGIQKYIKSLIVNVNHGMEGFKKIDKSYYQDFHADIHCASSIEEKRIKIENCGAESSKVFITGYPRFDMLETKIEEKNQSIVLLFLTWRPWLEHYNNRQLVESEYYNFVNQVLTSKEINKILIDNNTKLVCRLHHKISDMKLSSTLTNIEIATKDTNLSELIRNASILITDFSSVAWDFLYLDKPVLFFAPDIDKYKKEVGLYIDVQERKLGPFSSNVEKLTEDINALFDENYISRMENKNCFFAFEDKMNCARVMSLIKEKI